MYDVCILIRFIILSDSFGLLLGYVDASVDYVVVFVSNLIMYLSLFDGISYLLLDSFPVFCQIVDWLRMATQTKNKNKMDKQKDIYIYTCA